MMLTKMSPQQSESGDIVVERSACASSTLDGPLAATTESRAEQPKPGQIGPQARRLVNGCSVAVADVLRPLVAGRSG